MRPAQREAIAYGNSELGGIVLGGENVGVYTLGDDWSYDSKPGQVDFRTSLWIHGTDDEIDERLAVLDAALKDNGNLVVSFGVSVTGTLDLTSEVVAVEIEQEDPQNFNELILTASASAFLPIHLGHAINLQGLGAYQISQYVSDTVVRCRLPAGQSVPADANGLTFWIGRKFRSAVEDVRLGDGLSASGRVAHVIDSENEPNRRRFEVSFSFIQKHRNTRGHDRSRTEITMQLPPGGARTVKFKGSYTAHDQQDAYEIYTEKLAPYVAAEMERILGQNVSYGPVGSDQLTSPDNTYNIVNFEITREELKIPESIAAFDHPAITDSNLVIERPRTYYLGIKDGPENSAISIVYNCQIIDKTLDRNGLKQLWDTVVYPNLVAIASEMFESRVCVLNHNFRPNLKTFKASGSIVGILLDSGSSLGSYSRRVTYKIASGKTLRPRLDGDEFAKIMHQSHRTITAAVVVSYKEINSAATATLTPGGVFGFGGVAGQIGDAFNDLDFGPFDMNSGMGQEISFVSSDGGQRSDLDSYINFDPFGLPADPKVRYPKRSIGDGAWEEIDFSDTEEVRRIGEDGLGISSPALEITRLIVTVYDWANLKGTISRSGAQRAATTEVQRSGRTRSVVDN